MNDLIANWVVPYYPRILHGNYAHLEPSERKSFNQQVRMALSTLDETVVNYLLSARGWRERITGSWFCGLKIWSKFAGQIGEALIASEMGYAGQGYCFALACFADDVSAKYLMEYLNIYLLTTDCYYDQNWAMPALIWIDEHRNTDHSSRYLVPGGLWERFAEGKETGAWQLDCSKERFWEVMAYCRKHFLVAGAV